MHDEQRIFTMKHVIKINLHLSTAGFVLIATTPMRDSFLAASGTPLEEIAAPSNLAASPFLNSEKLMPWLPCLGLPPTV